MMAELPSHPELLCFSEYISDFQDKEFHVEEFISKSRKKVTIECLRQDLDAYYRTLKTAMVELINKDYADFVNLSANLVGMDNSIGDLITPLIQLQEEISSIKSSMESAIEAVDNRLAQRTQIRKDKDTLQRLLHILESVEKLERLLKIKHSSHDGQEDERLSEIEELAERPEFAPMVMERIASEFNRLQYNCRLTEHPLVEESKPRIAVITSTLQSKLECSFRHGLETKDRNMLIQCLQTYASINQCQAAESLFQILVVHPYMDKLISAKSVLSHPGGLSGLYADILRFIPECSFLLDITGGHGSAPEHAVVIKGFDFLVNSVWPQVVVLVEKKASVIFAPGNPDTFHRNYTASMEFVASFEEQCHTPSSMKALRNHPSFNTFMSKWSLPVYFQIRFQDIAGTLESCLALPFIPSPETAIETHDPRPHPPYKLELFSVLNQCIEKCWSNEVFLPALIHRFWKLTLQLLIRVSIWLEEISALPITKTENKKARGQEDDQSLPLPTIFSIIHDCEMLHTEVDGIFSNCIEPKLSQATKKSTLQESLLEAKSQIQQLVPKFSSLIVSSIAELCMQGLESANTLPRQYRRTNKEVPSKSSTYVSGALQPLQQMMGNFPSHYKVDWTAEVISKLTQRYFDIGSELLTSVQRTEESLLKLKSYRKSLVPSASTGGMTDDNKIRLQLALDIEQFNMKVLAMHPSAVHLPAFKQLLEMGQVAKTTALNTPPS